MKKILMGTAVTALVLTVGLTTAFAAGGRYYVDANGDGVCDNWGSYSRFVDADGDGVCDYQGTNCRFVDADGDGVCDYQGANCRSGGGYGGYGCHGGGRHGW